MTIWIPTVAAAADIVFFPVAAAIVVIGLQRSALSVREKRLFTAAAVFSFLAKVALGSVGHNYDLDTWRLFSDILAQGKNLYSDTDLYRYGPIWAWIVSGFGRLTGPGGGELFHMQISAFLAVIDVLTAMIIARTYSWTGAMVLLLSPVSLLISGFHTQLENVAVLVGLVAWLLIREGKGKLSSLLGSSVCLGVSLVAKHVLFLFPIWMLFWKPLGKLRYRLLYPVIAYAIFFGSFLPWWGDPASRAGMLKNVFAYRSSLGLSWTGNVAGLFMPIQMQVHAAQSNFGVLDRYLHRIPGGSVDRLWMALLVIAGAVLARKPGKDLYLFYLMILFASSPSVAPQYVIVPMIAAAIFYGYPESWGYIAAATLGNFLARSNIGGFLFDAISHSGVMLVRGRPYNLSDLSDVSISPFFLIASQFCIGVLVWRVWPPVSAPSTAAIPTSWSQIRRAAALVAVGGLPLLIMVVRKTMAYGSLASR